MDWMAGRKIASKAPTRTAVIARPVTVSAPERAALRHAMKITAALRALDMVATLFVPKRSASIPPGSRSRALGRLPMPMTVPTTIGSGVNAAAYHDRLR